MPENDENDVIEVHPCQAFAEEIIHFQGAMVLYSAQIDAMTDAEVIQEMEPPPGKLPSPDSLDILADMLATTHDTLRANAGKLRARHNALKLRQN